MTVIDMIRLEEAKEFIDGGGNCDSVTIEGGLQLTDDAVEWLKKNHWQLKIVETFSNTGVAAVIYPA